MEAVGLPVLSVLPILPTVSPVPKVGVGCPSNGVTV